MKKRFKRSTLVISSLIAGALLFSAGSFFQPWKLFTDTRVEEALPKLSAPPSNDQEKTPEVTEVEKEVEAVIASPVVISQGRFITHEHATTGAVKILQYEDGSRILRIEDLNTSNGPKLEVWLTDAPVIEGLDGWRVFDDGKYINLGALKGNIGSQNYLIPEDVNLDDFSSISIWCERFSVSFGAAALNLA